MSTIASIGDLSELPTEAEAMHVFLSRFPESQAAIWDKTGFRVTKHYFPDGIPSELIDYAPAGLIISTDLSITIAFNGELLNANGVIITHDGKGDLPFRAKEAYLYTITPFPEFTTGIIMPTDPLAELIREPWTDTEFQRQCVFKFVRESGFGPYLATCGSTIHREEHVSTPKKSSGLGRHRDNDNGGRQLTLLVYPGGHWRGGELIVMSGDTLRAQEIETGLTGIGWRTVVMMGSVLHEPHEPTQGTRRCIAFHIDTEVSH